MATIATIPFTKIDRIQLYVNGEKKSIDKIRAETGADYLLNGSFYENWKPVMHFRSNGVTYSSDQYNYVGLGWDSWNIRPVESKSKETVRNFICGVQLVGNGKPCEKLYYNADVGGSRGRSAVAIKGSNLILYCVGDANTGKCTPEELRGEMVALGVDYAVMLDGGSSSQCWFDGKSVPAQHIVQNLILVYLRKEEKTTKTPLVYLDPGHGGTDTSNGSPDGRYKEHEFSLDMGRRIQTILQNQGILVKLTRETASKSVSLPDRAAMANAANADLFVSLHSNADGSNGWGSTRGLVVYTLAAGGTRDVLAKNILAREKAAGVYTFGYELYHAKFVVLRLTNMPACLIEFLFHTNKDDVKLLLDSAYRDKMALGAAKGICDTLGVVWQDGEKKKYTVSIATLESKEQAQKIVDKLKEIGVTATIREEGIK